MHCKKFDAMAKILGEQKFSFKFLKISQNTISMKVHFFFGYLYYKYVEKRYTYDLELIIPKKCGSSLRGLQRQKSKKAFYYPQHFSSKACLYFPHICIYVWFFLVQVTFYQIDR